VVKHTEIRRADGDDYTIWIRRDAPIDDTGDLAKRQSARIATTRLEASWRSTSSEKFNTDKCKSSTWYDHTTPSSPTTGGSHAIVSWASQNHGYFITWYMADPAKHKGGRTLVIGGSNGAGGNTRFTVYVYEQNQNYPEVGTDDIRYQVQYGLDRYQKVYNEGGKSVWRMQMYGGGYCYSPNRQAFNQWINFEVVWTPQIV